MKRVLLIGAVCMGVGLSAQARADSAQDPMRCDALLMRRDGQETVCEARCLQLAALNNRRGIFAPTITPCEQHCEDRYKAAILRIKQGPPCTPEPPDPHRCAANLLSAQARQETCQSRCMHRPPDDQPDCTQSCDQDYGTAKDEILASDVCADGPAENP